MKMRQKQWDYNLREKRKIKTLHVKRKKILYVINMIKVILRIVLPARKAKNILM